MYIIKTSETKDRFLKLCFRAFIFPCIMILVLLYIPGPENGDIKQAASRVLTELPKEIKWQWWCLQFHLPFSLLSFSPSDLYFIPSSLMWQIWVALGPSYCILFFLSLFSGHFYVGNQTIMSFINILGEYITKQSLVWVWIRLCVVHIGKKAIPSLSLTLPSNSSALLLAWTLPRDVWHRPGNWDTTQKPLAWCFDSQLAPVSSGF